MKAGSLTLEGRVKPLSFLTNWRADARISSSVAGGAKLCSVLMFRHMRNPPLDTRKLQTEHLSKPATGSYQLRAHREFRSSVGFARRTGGRIAFGRFREI